MNYTLKTKPEDSRNMIKKHKKNLPKKEGWNFLCNSSCVEG